MWNTIIIIVLFIAVGYLIYNKIKNHLINQEKANKEKLSKKVSEEMAKKIMEDARHHRQVRKIDDDSNN